MPVERSAGAIIFKKEKRKIFYLLLHYPGLRNSRDYWDLPKGHIENGESNEETVRREVAEETGIKDLNLVPGFEEIIKYFFQWEGKNIFKTVTFFLAQTDTKEAKISKEHIGFLWLPCQEAIEKVAFKNAKEVIKKANDFLLGKSLPR
jgi:bis(5'-nucleosidyl)-tetraphosphatase